MREDVTEATIGRGAVTGGPRAPAVRTSVTGTAAVPRPAGRRRPGRTDVAILLVTALYALAYVEVNRWLPGNAAVRALSYEGFAVPVAVGCGVWAWRATQIRLPRLLLAGAALATMGADLLWDLDAVGWVSLSGHPVLTAQMYAPAYLLLLAALLVISSRWGDGSAAATLETLVVAAGAAIGGYPVLIDPYVDTSHSQGQIALGVVSPVGDVLVLSGLVLLLPKLRAVPAIWLLTGGMAAWLVADHEYRLELVTNTYTPGGWVDVLWLVQYAAILLAMRRCGWPATERCEHVPGTSWLKVTGLGVAAMVPPAWLVISQARFDADRARQVLVPLCVATVVVVALLMIRLALLVHAHTTATQRLNASAAERQRLTESLEHQAFHDALTGLPNRALLMAVVSDLSRDGDVALAFVDLDDFKNINDTLGHEAGDRVLCAVADRIRSHTRGGDLVVRLGGDEFAVLMPGITLTDAERRIEHLLDSISAPLDVDGVVLRVAASIGVAPLTSDYDGSLAAADMAMYAVKKAGKGRVGIYDQEMSRQVLSDASLAADLRRALEEGGLFLEYQPIVSLTDGTVRGCEALLRWAHPRLGPLAPGAFLAVAEQRGLAVTLDRWVLEEAVQQIARWYADGVDLPMNVNTSAAFLGDEAFVTTVIEALQHHALPGHLLTIEITEQSLVADVTVAAERLHRLRDHGVRVALDDFGSGYSGLAYLQDMPVDVLKLDKSFVRVDADGVPGGPLLGVVVGLGHALRMQVLAEGIESTVQEETLRGLGCDLGQGWRWTKALGAEPLRAWLAEYEAARAPAGAVAASALEPGPAPAVTSVR